MLASRRFRARVSGRVWRALILTATIVLAASVATGVAKAACEFDFGCPAPELAGGAATVGYTGAAVGALVAGTPEEAARYQWRLRTLCEIHDEKFAACSASDFRPCPQMPGRIITFL